MTTFLRVFDYKGNEFFVQPDAWHSLDAAITEFLDSGETRDRLVELSLLDGSRFMVRASTIMGVMHSTSETRREAVRLRQVEKEEIERVRHELGIWDEDD